MVKRGSSTFSAASVAKGSVVLSRAIEKNFALEAEVSRLRHHVSILSRRLHSITIERDGLRDMVIPTMEVERWGREPQGSEEVADDDSDDGAAPVVAGMSDDDGGREATSVADEVIRDATSVADEDVTAVARGCSRFTMDLRDDDDWWERRMREGGRRRELAAANRLRPDVAEREATSVADEDVPAVARGCNRFAMDLVEEEESVPVPIIPSGMAEAVVRRSGELESEGAWPTLGAPNGSTEVTRMTHSSDEDVVLGGVIVAGGTS